MLLELRDNKQIVINPADKGSAIVIWDRERYLWEEYRQLYEPQYYTKLDRTIYDTIPMIKDIGKKYVNKIY